ncbi:MAG: hypothetical protein LBS10_10925 [Gracilibacteraceae bacterium]|jgi:aldehyde:ferredoxin oxidoreductase|nr:hypothetical protein [Gracilibacteraceae bacterium]
MGERKIYGHIGKMLFVNLTTKVLEDKEIPLEWYADFIGGPALGARILYEYMPAGADVFGEDSMVGFVTGPYNNATMQFGGRYTVVSKSPVYNGWNDANSGGYFGPQLKKAGYDGVFVNGISETPVYIWIDDGKAEIRDASKYWGLCATEFEKAMFQDIGDDGIKMSFIGPAGEKMSHIAAVMNDGHRAAGRGGTGAVIGSKKLKAVVCRGKQKIELFDKAGMLEFNRMAVAHLKVHPAMGPMGTFGTTGGFLASTASGDAGVKNYSCSLEDVGMTAQDFDELGAPKLTQKYKSATFRCHSCALGCGAFLDIDDEKYPMKHVPRPEYESLGWWGPCLLVKDSVAVTKCNDIAGEYGCDTISCGGTVAWIFECFNQGLLTKEELGGIEPYWGDGDAAVAITQMVASQEGPLGEIFGNGSQYAADKLGKGHEFLFVASGIEIAQHDPRRAPGYDRTFQLDPSPGRHTKGGLAKANDQMTMEQKFDYRVTGFHDVSEICNTEFINSAGLCIFSIRLMPPGSIFDALKYVTGVGYKDPVRLRRYGMRAFTMRWMFNIREGLRRKDFTLSYRVGEFVFESGPLKGIKVDYERLGDNLYNAIGYDAEGVPRRDMLEFVGGMEHVIRDLYGEGGQAAAPSVMPPGTKIDDPKAEKAEKK